jgi:preprotein translocase subunit Sec61beta
MKFRQTGAAAPGPSSTLGIMRFFDTEMGGPKLGPEFVIGIAVAFCILIIFIRLQVGA